MLVLGIESSCDDTAAAVVEDGAKVLSNITASQNEIHSKYGGVVPELASRRHVENMPVVINEALEQAGVGIKDIGLLAVTHGPGLVGALLVGLSAAKGIAWALKKPLVPVHHLHGHIVAARFNHKIMYPHICLLVSGGHTSLFKVLSPTTQEELASTRDDAAGEAFDKVAKLLGLGFPGGPAVEKAAKEGKAVSLKFTMPKIKPNELYFSFSGLKTAVRTTIQQNPKVEDVAASFQKTVTEILVSHTIAAAKEQGLGYIVLAGGVACNGYLRGEMKRACDMDGLTVVWPEPVFCTDNAAMIAAAGYFTYSAAPDDPRWHDYVALDAVANLPL